MRGACAVAPSHDIQQVGQGFNPLGRCAGHEKRKCWPTHWPWPSSCRLPLVFAAARWGWPPGNGQAVAARRHQGGQARGDALGVEHQLSLQLELARRQCSCSPWLVVLSCPRCTVFQGVPRPLSRSAGQLDW